MAKDNARSTEESGALEAEKKLDRSSCPSRPRDQRGGPRVKNKPEEGRLPTPPPDPQCPPAVALASRDHRSGVTSRGPEEEEEDLAAYLGELGASPFEGQSFDYDTTPNSATSAMGGDATPCTEEAFEHLDRLCALTEQILELRTRSSEYFRRVRNLERAKVQRNANRRLEIALANGEELYHDFVDEDTGFAESLLDAMLSNCRDAASSTPRRNERSAVRSSASSSSSSSRQRSRSLVPVEQNLGSRLVEQTVEVDKCAARNASRNGGPKVSKWTRVKAAFKWERACTNDLADIAESESAPATTSSPPTTRYLRIPDATTAAGSWSTGSTTLSPCTSEVSSPSTPIGRVSSASSSNDEVFDDSRKNVVNYPDRQSPFVKDDKKRDDPDRYGRSLDRDTSVTESVDSIESPSEANRGKPLIRIISDADAAVHAASGSGKDPESPKRPMPILTITIPSNEEEIRSLSSPESMSPLPSSAQDSGGSSPQRPRMRPDIFYLKEFKRQYSTIEEAVTPTPKIQQQDSKWNKVRRAFLTNATFSVPPSPIRLIAPQSFPNDDTRRARSCSESVEDLGKTVAGTNNNGNYREARRDYQALREKFGAEFHRKLIEWERLKGGPQNVRNGLPLNEERLAPEFRKKLQEWKRAKKGRRSSAAIEQQRVSRRRLTDWQLWRTSSKPEPRCYGKNQSSIGSRGSCASIGSAGSFGSDGKQHLCEDFIKRMEAWRRMSEAACRSDRPKSPTTMNRVASDIDETEFLALEKLLLLFGQRTRKELRESDARQLNDCFDGDSRFMAASRGDEVLIRTSVGSYRFEGISREFTRKLYDWEKYRGISPRSSTFRLLGPGYTPFAQDSDEAALAEPNKNAFHWTLKRSKSDGSIFEGSLRDESFTLRRSASLQSLTSADKLEDDTRMDILPVSNNSQRIKDPEDIAVEDSEPEAMIVDIEDVIEETASPLTGVQPHQTPVYSVAASETTSIAVPLGTVTSSHEPSPVFLVKTEGDEDCERWNSGKLESEAFSRENSPSPEYFPGSDDWREKATSLDEDKPSWEPSWCKESKEDNDSAGWTEKKRRSIPDSGDSVKSDRSIGWNRDTWDESGDEANRDSTGLELHSTPTCESKNDTRKQDFLESDNVRSTDFAKSLETSSTASNAEEFMDPPHTCKGMDETCQDETCQDETCEEKLEDLADESSNNEGMSDAKDLQDDEGDDEKAKRGEIILNADFCAYQLTSTVPSSGCCDSKETSLKISNLKLDDNKDASECGGVDSESEASAHYESCGSPELQTDADRHYEILTFKTDTCGDTMDNGLYEPVDYHETRGSCYDSRSNCVKEISSSSRLTEVKKANLLETSRDLLINSTVQTVPVTISRNNDARCLERILINEETLNKIVVPTACAENETRSTEKIRNRFASMNRTDETAVVNNHTSKRVIRDHEVESVKKDGSSTRNVFVKTKRMIFGPFRRSEDRPSSRKQSDSSIDGRLPRSSKSKSKSRSASPKSCRQDTLLRVSLSLPWPLRSTSKEGEITSKTESRRNSESKAEDATTIQDKNSLCEESNVENKRLNKQLSNKELPFIDVDEEENCSSDTEFATAPINACSIATRISEQREKSKSTMIERDQSVRRMRGELKRGQTQDDAERDKIENSQVQFDGKYNRGRSLSQKREEGWREEVKFGRKQDEARQQDENHARSDAVPSDLMHKLRILSDAAAKREGRATTAESSVVNSLESRSSRIRRAKESFLSRRGGPFCRSESTDAIASSENNPWRRTSTTRISTTTEMSGPSEIAMNSRSASISGKSEDMRKREEATSSTAENEIVSPIEDKIDARQVEEQAIDVAVRSDSLVKSASAGMINVDPDTFDRLVTVDRGCESLPRAIAKRRDSSSPLAKIVGKLKLSRLIRARNVDGGSMSTITTLCRQSLLIDMRNRRSNEREIENDPVEDDTDDDHSGESSKTIHE